MTKPYNGDKKGETVMYDRVKKAQRLREWRAKNPHKTKEYEAKRKDEKVEYYASKRRAVIKMLGGKCMACHYDDPEAIHIDHIFGGGGLERKTRTICVTKFMNQILKGLRTDLRLLCSHCNERAKRHGSDIEKWPSTTLKRIMIERDINDAIAQGLQIHFYTNMEKSNAQN